MAKLFGNFMNFNRPGPGVSKNVPKKNRFFLFWELFFRKFWDLCHINLIFVMCLIPFGLASFGIYKFLQVSSFSITNNLSLAFIITFLPFLFCGPFVGGLGKITREFAREIPVFIWSDYWEAVKKNWKQTICLSAIGYLTFSFLAVALPFYYLSDFGILSYLFFGLCALVAVIVLFMQYYVYLMAVSLDLTIKEILKNSAILSMLCFFKNLLLTLVLVVLIGAAVASVVFWGIISLLVFLALAVVFLLGFFAFLDCFVVFPSLQKYIIDPYYEQNPQETSASLQSQSEEGEKGQSQQEELPEYVYHNGKMVHRSVLEKEVLFDDTSVLDKKHSSEDKL